MPVDVAFWLAAVVGTITCRTGTTTTFRVAFSSNAPRLSFPCFGRSCGDISRKWTKLFFKCSVMDYVLRNVLLLGMLRVVGSTMDFVGKIVLLRKTEVFVVCGLVKCWRWQTGFLHPTAGMSSSKAEGLAARMQRSSFSGRALWLAAVSNKADFFSNKSIVKVCTTSVVLVASECIS